MWLLVLSIFCFKTQVSDKEVAAMLGIGVSTVWKKTNDPEGNFPRPFNITERARRWRKSDIIDWVKGLNYDKAKQPA